MPEPNFQIDGDNNRTAGRDYHEYRGPETCPCCELRFLTPGRVFCRHCEALFQREKIQQELAEKQGQRRVIASRVALVLACFMISGLLLNWFGPESLHSASLILMAVSAFVGIVIAKFFT